jgi:hypothetical protein
LHIGKVRESVDGWELIRRRKLYESRFDDDKLGVCSSSVLEVSENLDTFCIGPVVTDFRLEIVSR